MKLGFSKEFCQQTVLSQTQMAIIPKHRLWGHCERCGLIIFRNKMCQIGYYQEFEKHLILYKQTFFDNEFLDSIHSNFLFLGNGLDK